MKHLMTKCSYFHVTDDDDDDDDDDELFCGMVDRRKAFSLISSRVHCQRSSQSRISDTPGAGFEPIPRIPKILYMIIFFGIHSQILRK